MPATELDILSPLDGNGTWDLYVTKGVPFVLIASGTFDSATMTVSDRDEDSNANVSFAALTAPGRITGTSATGIIRFAVAGSAGSTAIHLKITTVK